MQTVAAGDEAQGCGRVEREVQFLKETTRLLLPTTEAPVAWWPLALRQAVEMRHRAQLQALGIPQYVTVDTIRNIVYGKGQAVAFVRARKASGGLCGGQHRL